MDRSIHPLTGGMELPLNKRPSATIQIENGTALLACNWGSRCAGPSFTSDWQSSNCRATLTRQMWWGRLGYDVKALRTIIRMRKQDANERAEQETILETYLQALGML